jgi:hypothetical protein
MAISHYCPGCDDYKAGNHEILQIEHSCRIKDLPEIKRGTLMVYEYTKPIYFLFNCYAPGCFCKCIDGSTSANLEHGKVALNIFGHSTCREATADERNIYRMLVEKSKYATAEIKKYI